MFISLPTVVLTLEEVKSSSNVAFFLLLFWGLGLGGWGGGWSLMLCHIPSAMLSFPDMFGALSELSQAGMSFPICMEQGERVGRKRRTSPGKAARFAIFAMEHFFFFSIFLTPHLSFSFSFTPVI